MRLTCAVLISLSWHPVLWMIDHIYYYYYCCFFIFIIIFLNNIIIIIVIYRAWIWMYTVNAPYWLLHAFNNYNLSLPSRFLHRHQIILLFLTAAHAAITNFVCSYCAAANCLFSADILQVFYLVLLYVLGVHWTSALLSRCGNSWPACHWVSLILTKLTKTMYQVVVSVVVQVAVSAAAAAAVYIPWALSS